MYAALDPFLEIGTWYTRHPSDIERFYECLETIVHKPDFNPDSIGEYITQKLDLDRWPEGHAYNVAADQYVEDAWAVKRYLKFLGR